MAVRIPQYQQQTAPNSLGTTPHARGVGIDDSIGQGMQQFAGTLMGVGQQLEAQRRHDEAEDAKVWTANATAKAQQDMATTFAGMQETVAEGAPNFTKDFTDKFSEYEEGLLANAPNDTSRKFLGERLLALRADMSNRALGFEVEERRRWRVNTGKQAIDTVAATAAMDPARAPVMLAEQRAMIDALEVPPEQKRALRDHLNDTVSTAVALGEIERDPLMARAKLADRLGIDAAAAAGGGSATAEVVWERMIDRESGGQQLGKDGKPLTSPKGAIGRAQVMPDTGPIAARLAGLPWDPARYRTDPDYNTALGRAYYDEQLREFGSPALAAAAYNAGPGAVREWIGRFGDPRKGAITVAEFAAKIPYKETREYVAAVAPPSRTPTEVAHDPEAGEATGDAIYDLLPVPTVVTLLARTNQEMEKQQAQLRAAVAVRENDDLAAFADGKAVAQPISSGEFVAAFGPVEGMRRAEAYGRGQQFAGALSQLATMAPEDINRTVAEWDARAQPGAGYENAAKYRDALVHARAVVLQQRHEDPIAFAAGAGLATIEPLNLADPEAMGAELKNRAGVAATMRDKYRTPYSLLTRGEVDSMTATMRAMSAPEKADFLATVRGSLPDAVPYHSIMAQLRPDSPVTATAGSMLALPAGAKVAIGDDGMFSAAPTMTGAQVARTILIGEDLLNPPKDAKGQDGKPKFALPSDKDLRLTWAEYTGTAYAGAPEAEQSSFQAYRAFYAAEAARLGQYDGEFNEDVAQQAARAVTGGVEWVGGSQIVLPYGVGAETTLDLLKAQWSTARAAAGLSPSIDLGAVNLQTVGDGLYAVSAGTGPVRDKAGRPILLRVDTAQVLSGLPAGAPP